MKKYRSAKGRTIDWSALANSSVPVEQREIQRKPAPDTKPATRMIGGHVPAPAEEVEEAEEVVETKPRGRKKAEVVDEEVTPPSE